MSTTSSWPPDDSIPTWTDGNRKCFGSKTLSDLALMVEDTAGEKARVEVIPCVSIITGKELLH